MTRIVLLVGFLFLYTHAMAQPQKLTSPNNALALLQKDAEKYVKQGNYQRAYTNYLTLVQAYKQRKNKAGMLDNVYKIVALHSSRNINISQKSLLNYYLMQQQLETALNIRTKPDTYLATARTYARLGNSNKAIFYAEKWLRINNNAEAADALKSFLGDLGRERSLDVRSESNLRRRLTAIQEEIQAKDSALKRMEMRNYDLKKQLGKAKNQLTDHNQRLKNQMAIARNSQRQNEILEQVNDSRRAWNIVLAILLFLGLVGAGFAVVFLLMSRKKQARTVETLDEKQKELDKQDAKLIDVNKTLQIKNKEIIQQDNTIQLQQNELDERKIELVRLVEDNLKQRKQLNNAQKARLKLAENIAKDLKKPLDMILRSRDLDTMRNAGQQIKAYTEEMLVVQQFLDNKLELRKGTFNFHDTVQAAIEPWLAQAHQKEIKVENTIDKSLWGNFDKVMIARVFEKLFRNSLLHTLSGGQITLGANQMTTPETNQAAKTVGIELFISDTGASILSEEYAKIFMPFMEMPAKQFANDAVAGIDLTFCKVAIEAHHTFVKVSSEPKTGTTFSFPLPVAEPPAHRYEG